MDKMQNLLKTDFGGAPVVMNGYEDFFEGLVNIVSNRKINDEVGEAVKTYVMDYISSREFDVRNYSNESYVRNYIGKDERSGWEAILMSWTEGNKTAIHSHPQFASYTIVEGKFLVEIFEPCGEFEAKLKTSFIADTPQCLYAVSEKNDYNNHIHRITCLSDKGHTLHIYSDDALLGKKYTVKD